MLQISIFTKTLGKTAGGHPKTEKMARRKKNTVDYFPHDAKEGKSLFILQSMYGSDGYVVNFKVMQVLAESENHVYDCTNTLSMEYLIAKIGVEADKCKQILDTMAALDIIDAPLWEKKVLYSKNFIENIKDVYARRFNELPTYGDIVYYYETQSSRLNYTENPPEGSKCILKPRSEGISDNENPQSKVEESKVEESKGKESKSKPRSVAAAKKDFSFLDAILEKFCKAHGDYEIVNRGKERAAAGKILAQYKQKYPGADSGETLRGLADYFDFCVNIEDKWLRDNMSPSLIVSKFNEIKKILKNGKAATTDNYRQKLYARMAAATGAGKAEGGN